MRHMLKTIGIAGLLTLTAGAASAQEFRIGIGDDRQDRIERRMERRMDGRMDRRMEREIEEVGSVERRSFVRDEPRVRIIQRNVLRERPRVKIVCRTVTKVTRVGNTIIRRPTEECTRRTVSTRSVIIR